MRWVNHISQLSYYHQTGNAPCYCEQLAFPSDILLQGLLPTSASSGYNLTVYVYSPDGLTQYEDATSFFQWYVGTNPQNKRFFNLRTMSYSPAMCLYQCWILRVVVTVNSAIVFDKFTDQYCKSTCCDTPRIITFDGGTCEVLVNNINKIYLYDVIGGTSTLLYEGLANYSDIAILGQKVYARDGYTGNIEVHDWNGTTLTYHSTLTSLPTGAALGADNNYLYLDDGLTIKRLDVQTNSLVTVVPSLGTTVQGDIVILNDGSIMVSQGDGSGGTNINVYNGGFLITTYNIPGLTGFYGMFFHANILYLMRQNGDVYILDIVTGNITLYSSYLSTVVNNTQWNGAAQRFNCEVSFVSNSNSAEEITASGLSETPIPYAVNCGKPLLTIKATFDCIDNETGYYFGIPKQVITGNANFSFSFVSSIVGRLRGEARTITKITSFNCYVQRSESFNKYTLDSAGMEAWLPEWKLREIENMLHASKVEINDYGIRYGNKEFLLDGDAEIGERVYACWDLFRINIPLRECTVRTNFGCGECEALVDSKSLLIQNNSSGNYYTQNRELIGNWDNLIAYYTGLGFDVEDSTGMYSNTVHSMSIYGLNIPYVFADYVSPINKIYPTDNPVAPIVVCEPFSLGYIYGEVATCDDFELGYIYGERVTPYGSVSITDYGDWATTGNSELTTINGKINLTTLNPAVTNVDTVLGGEPIGIIGSGGRPLYPQFIDLGSDRQISISTSGVISFYGVPDSINESGATITLTDIYYQLT